MRYLLVRGEGLGSLHPTWEAAVAAWEVQQSYQFEGPNSHLDRQLDMSSINRELEQWGYASLPFGAWVQKLEDS